MGHGGPRVVAAVDRGDAYYQDVLTTARRLAGEHPLTVLCIHPRGLQWARDPARTQENQSRALREQVAERLREDLARWAPGLSSIEVPLSSGGSIGEDIVAHVSRLNGTLVVLGTHGRSGLEAWVVGSVAEYVVRHVPCDVYVVRAHR